MLTVIHHTDWDGYAAAYAVQQAVRHGFIPGQTTGTLRFVAANYGDEPPVPLKDSHVIIVDFCYGVDDLKKVKEQALSVIVIDHHLTTPPVCEEAAVKCVFDDTKSGAVLAWEYLFGAAKDVPVFLQYVQDNDLWRFKLPCSKLVRAYLQSMPPSLNEAEIQADRFKGDFEGITREATIVGRIRGRVIDEALKTRHVVELGGHRITAFNAHYFGPEVADTASYILSSPFFAVWVKIGDKYRVSIYKRNEVNDAFKSTIDLSVIAKAYGGGGHANAAGFMCDVLPWEASPEVAPAAVSGRKTKSRSA